MMVDGYTLWTKLDSPIALALHIFTMQQEGIDTSRFRYEDLLDCPPNMVPIKKEKKKDTKRKTEEDESKQKQPKKPRRRNLLDLAHIQNLLKKVLLISLLLGSLFLVKTLLCYLLPLSLPNHSLPLL